MSVGANKDVVRRFYAAYGERDLDAVGNLLAADFVAYFGTANAALDRATYFGFVRQFYTAFPDLANTVEELVGEGEFVAARTTWRGTHRGEFLGVPATGKPVTFASYSTSRFVDGKMAEHHFIGDMLAVLQQLGALPAPAQTTG